MAGQAHDMGHNRSMKFLIIALIYSVTWANTAQIVTKQETLNTSNFPKFDDYANYHKTKGLDSFYDPNIDYSKFSGRVSDKSSDATILKIQVESLNTKFFKASDPLKFWVTKKREEEPCQGNIRAIEKGYLTLYVKNLYPCWGPSHTFRRGTILVFKSDRLAKRIQTASRYRVALLAKKRDFLYQLNRVNKFVWGFRQEQVDLAAQYDKQILELQKKKEQALNLLLAKKKDQIKIQKELIYRLDELDQDLTFYRVEKDELYTDRWHLDQDAGVPVYKKPAPLKVE
ncbi:hypothetical protein M901_2108 [Bacteriovorax sp. DB6_IX]|nr:hypothetical protein M901_2108 [Bacteriovorax sp. DB6_IX]